MGQNLTLFVHLYWFDFPEEGMHRCLGMLTMNFKKYQNGYSRKNSSNNSNSCEPVCCTTDGL